MKSTYLWVDFLTVIIPFIFSFHPKLNFYKNFKPFFAANALVAIFFIGWDIHFTQIGVWGFNSDYVTGLHFINLPIEEILFFICIPFACVFTYHCLNLFFKIRWSLKTKRLIVLGLSGTLFFTGMFFHTKLYTSYTFISLSVLLLAIHFVAKVKWLPTLFMVYLVLLLPFLIVNGILTGTGLEQPIVWYNNDENLGIRLMTIPVEDVFYGFELILLNVFFYEYFKGKFHNQLAKQIPD